LVIIYKILLEIRSFKVDQVNRSKSEQGDFTILGCVDESFCFPSTFEGAPPEPVDEPAGISNRKPIQKQWKHLTIKMFL